ncbi:MAG: FAD-dependent oxidoreductase [Alphaproteobacteria bacterium]|nr:FAD-dependent oxidoreductase [Alphaproteobacteria bacterium]
MNHTDVAIIGGGVAGLALAVLLGKAGLAVSVVEQRNPATIGSATRSGRTAALMRSSLNILQATGAWEACKACSAQIERMRIIDDSARQLTPVEVGFEATDIGLEYFGFNVPNQTLHAALAAEALALDTITFHAPTALADYTAGPHRVTARLEDGEEIDAALLVGADGANSAVRARAGIDTWVKRYDQTALTCLVNHSKSHGHCSTEFHRAGGPFALVPLPGNRSSVVWVEKTIDSEGLRALQKEDFIETLQAQTRDILGVITLETPPEYWPLQSLKATALVGRRMALIAEAAHVMSPITAQGLNLSLRDVAALAETIVDARRLGIDIGAFNVLERYEKRRRLDIRSRVFGVNAINHLVSNEIEPVKLMRRLSLKTIDRVYPLKRFTMRQGLCPPVDAGRLAQGGKL